VETSPPAPAATTATEAAKAPPRREIVRATCRTGAGNCAAATGRIIFLERVDPDGDGDLHLVITGGSVTGPGFTVLDVGKDLRPRRDPRIGDLASGAGPVYRGSYGQRQIQVTELHVLRRR
jgi:hypothetical protein